MTPRRRELVVVPLARAGFEDAHVLADDGLTLGELLREQPAFVGEPLTPADLTIRVSRLHLLIEDPDPARAMYWPPGIEVAGRTVTAPQQAEPTEAKASGVVLADDGHPAELDDRRVVLIAHDLEITRAAAYLDSGLSVLIRCEKLLVEHLVAEIAGRAGRRVRTVEATEPASDVLGIAPSRRQQVLAGLQTLVRDAKPADVVVVPHLDLLAGGSDATLNAEARELTDVLYERSGCVLLAFTDPSLVIPEVLANRFAVRVAIDILPREVRTQSGDRVPAGTALVTRDEAALFRGFDPMTLYKHIAGFNAVRLRHALRYAYHQHRGTTSTFEVLIAELRTFKARTSSAFEVPNVSFTAIGGYDDIKRELHRALKIIRFADDLPERMRHDLVPRGFIFHGPPGTGKTLFAKAIANAFDATILVVSGPEITDMYVGEGERKVREIFAEARRNAPAVIVFDEFDSIASRRSGRDDGGNRAGNAMVAQLLTEMDGFRPEVPVVVIGTTNRIDIIDDALLRPSRFKPIRIDLPDEPARRHIARVHADHFEVPVSDELLDGIARATEKMNGDEIRSIFRDARADELVGEPPVPADAYRLGTLIGLQRRAAQERDVDRDQTQPRRPGHRPRMIVLSATPSTEEPA
ncbi:ATP-binding protein [Actinoplanes oblitus]|uniref:ATP-binding protein n=1 Tax=Actinoplanes oblitus TaxID=3040509 RepID=A0ABY8WNK0_9ACTN|nr:ATP-binding protein [Actinoplanes oblitus]WIM99415.1 ATP-binding protein [Actinoplanes oblitus]